MTRDNVKQILAKLTILYPHFTVGEPIAGFKPTDVWFEMIGDMDFEKAMEAVKACAKKCKYPPTIAEIQEEYDKIMSAEKHEQGEIKRYFEYARSYYPGSGEAGYGWKEFSERAKTKEDAARLQTLIMDYVRYVETSGGSDVIDFAECCKTVRRDGGNITVGNVE